MTTKEQQTIDNLFKAVQDLRSENSKFREDVKLQVEAINTKIEKKHIPITLEQDILRTAQIINANVRIYRFRDYQYDTLGGVFGVRVFQKWVDLINYIQ